MIGLKRGEVRLCSHEKVWEENAVETIAALKSIFGNAAVDLQHVGSTAIPSIKAKPVIDIAVGVKSFEDVNPLIEKLKAAGFYYRVHKDLYEQMLFAAGSYYDGTGSMQTHFVHTVIHGGDVWNNYISFRDYLNKHIEAAKEYEKIKLHLAENGSQDGTRTAYIDGKHEFVMSILKKAGVQAI